MKKHVLLGTVLVSVLNYAAVPAFAQTSEFQQRVMRPGDGRPDRPGPGRPGEGRPGEGRPGDGRPDRPGRPGDGRPGDGRPDRPGPGRPGDGRPGDGRPDRPGRPDDGRPGPGRPGPGRPDHGRPDRPGPGRPWPSPGPVRPPMPPPQERYYEDIVQISSVTRRAGGEWFRLTLRRPVSIENLQIMALSAGVKIHEARVYTVFGRTSYIPEFTPSRTFYAGDRVSASYFTYERIQSIDIRAESMGGYADLRIRAVSNDDYPRLDVSRF